MFSETGKTPRDAALSHAEKKRNFLKAQGEVLRDAFGKIGLEKSVEVTNGTKIIKSEQFRNKPTIGLVTGNGSTTDYPLAFFASAASDETNVKVVMIAPTADDSRLYTDDKGTIATDSFWSTKKAPTKTVIEHTQTSRPIHLDKIVIMSGRNETLDSALEAELTQTEITFAESNSDKHTTKQTLRTAGVDVPDGIFLPTSALKTKLTSAYEDFAAKISEGEQVVIKPNDGATGDNVLMGDPHSSQFNRQALKEILAIRKDKDYKGLLIEKRIDAAPQPALAELLNASASDKETRIESDQVDWNMRILTTLGIDPQIIEGEIRYQRKNGDPVNASKGAKTARLDSINDPELIEQAYATAKKAVAAMYKASYHDGDPASSVYWAGVDIIVGKTQKQYVIEVQPTGGGFSSLTKIDGEPLNGVRTVYLSEQGKALATHVDERQPINPADLRKIKPAEETKLLQYDSHKKAGNYREAQNILMTMIGDYHDLFGRKTVIGELSLLIDKTGDTRAALQYVNKLDQIYHIHPDWIRFRQQLLRRHTSHAKKKRK